MASLRIPVLNPRAWLLIGRVLAWVLAIALLIAETREVFELRQLTQLTQFALIFLLAQYQLSTAIYYKTIDDLLAVKIKQCSSQMFLASVFAAADAALDQAVKSIKVALEGNVDLLVRPLFLLGWLINLAMIVLALSAFDRFMRLLAHELEQSHSLLIDHH